MQQAAAFRAKSGVEYTFADMPRARRGDVCFIPASDQSLLVSFASPPRRKQSEASPNVPTKGHVGAQHSNVISAETHQKVRRLLRMFELEPVPGVKNLHPAYSSVLVKFDPLTLHHNVLEARLRDYIARMSHVPLPEPRVVEIPVCYGGECGPDLNDVAAVHKLTAAKVIELHSSTIYTAYFLGFTPGFAYLGELPEPLHTPRLAAPRRSVSAGSVGIAGSQTGIYPISTPGGWRLLGRTPVAMFQPDRPAMSLLAIGDRVRFVPISPEKFAAAVSP